MKFNLPDGSTRRQLTASGADTGGQFAIGATPAATSAKSSAAERRGLHARQHIAGRGLRHCGGATFADPPQRVATTPLATALRLPTAQRRIRWTGTGGTARARRGRHRPRGSMIRYRSIRRATEQDTQPVAVSRRARGRLDQPNASAQVAALSQRVTQNLTAQPRQQTIQDIQADFSVAQNTMKDATARQTGPGHAAEHRGWGRNVSPDQV